MYRQRIRQQILYGQFREYTEIAGKVIALRQQLGLAPRPSGRRRSAPRTRWCGRSSIRTSQWRLLWQLAVQGSTQDELLQKAPLIA